MDVIDVRDLPEPLARALEMMVQTLRDQLRDKQQRQDPAQQKVTLPTWPGTVIGSLKREDIYADI